MNVAGFFNPSKTATTAEYNRYSVMVNPSINQYRKMQEKSSIIMYNAGGTARKVVDANGNVSYK